MLWKDESSFGYVYSSHSVRIVYMHLSKVVGRGAYVTVRKLKQMYYATELLQFLRQQAYMVFSNRKGHSPLDVCWLSCNFFTRVAHTSYLSHASHEDLGWFLFWWKLEFWLLHGFKMFHFVHWFQSSFCFRSTTISSAVRKFFGL